MGSTGYLTCGICWMCGKCYPREDVCPQCGSAINLDEDRCAYCGRAIDGEDRLRARARFMALKKAEAAEDFPTNSVHMRMPGAPVPVVNK